MRQVSLLIGRQSYSMKTTLSESEIKDALAVVEDALRDTGGITSEQEIRLAVACMVLANKIASAGRRLDYIISEEEKAEE
ncbi:MAG: hypothetical protein LBR87_04040 [Synergistaceae bacterium]|jgi:hypothetical protein|nr:hypothetical protein [Synergistaceae bacterium]